MLIAIVPLVFAVIGALIYALASNGKAVEIGRLTFMAAMIALMIAMASHTIHVG